MLSVLSWLWTKAIQVQKASQSVSQSVLPWGEPVLKKAKEKAFPEKRKNARRTAGIEQFRKLANILTDYQNVKIGANKKDSSGLSFESLQARLGPLPPEWNKRISLRNLS